MNLRLHSLIRSCLSFAAIGAVFALFSSPAYATLVEQNDEVLCEQAVLSDSEIRLWLLQTPELWLNRAGYSSHNMSVEFHRYKTTHKTTEISVSYFFEVGESSFMVGEMIFENVGKDWFSHVNVEVDFPQKRGFGTFMYMASAYLLHHYFNIDPISAPHAPNSEPRSEAGTGQWRRLQRLGLAKTFRSDKDGDHYRFRLNNVMDTPFARLLDRLMPTDVRSLEKREAFKQGRISKLNCDGR